MSLDNGSLAPSSLPQGNSGRNCLNYLGFGDLFIILIVMSHVVALAWVTVVAMKLKITADELDYFWLVTIRFIMIYLLSPIVGAAIFRTLSKQLLPLVVDKKILRGEEEETDVEAPTWFPIIPAAGCCLFLLASGLISWQINSYLLERASYLSKPGGPTYYGGVSDILLRWFRPTLCCCGLNLSMALAYILAYVATLINRVSDVEMAPFDQPYPAADQAERKVKRFKILKTTRFPEAQLALLLCYRLISSGYNYQGGRA